MLSPPAKSAEMGKKPLTHRPLGNSHTALNYCNFLLFIELWNRYNFNYSHTLVITPFMGVGQWHRELNGGGTNTRYLWGLQRQSLASSPKQKLLGRDEGKGNPLDPVQANSWGGFSSLYYEKKKIPTSHFQPWFIVSEHNVQPLAGRLFRSWKVFVSFREMGKNHTCRRSNQSLVGLVVSSFLLLESQHLASWWWCSLYYTNDVTHLIFWSETTSNAVHVINLCIS